MIRHIALEVRYLEDPAVGPFHLRIDSADQRAAGQITGDHHIIARHRDGHRAGLDLDERGVTQRAGVYGLFCRQTAQKGAIYRAVDIIDIEKGHASDQIRFKALLIFIRGSGERGGSGGSSGGDDRADIGQ